MKLAVTGADGFLGSRLAVYFEKRVEVVRAGHAQLELTEEEQVKEWMEAAGPDVVLHCAAISDTGACERDAALSERVNVRGTLSVARACERTGSRLVIMSSDQVYTGVHAGGTAAPRPNREEDAKPSNVYGRDKLRAEEEVLACLRGAVCLRLPWMYDLPVRGMKLNRNLLCSIMKALIRDEPLALPVHEYRGISYVWEVVRHMEQAMDLPGGVYNFGGGNAYSTYETGRRVLHMLTDRGDGLLVRDEERFSQAPCCLTMDTGKAQAGGILFPDTVQGFEACLSEHPEFMADFAAAVKGVQNNLKKF